MRIRENASWLFWDSLRSMFKNTHSNTHKLLNKWRCWQGFIDIQDSVFMCIKETRWWGGVGGHLTFIQWWPDWHVIPPGITPKPLPCISNANAGLCEETFIVQKNNPTSSTSVQPKHYIPSMYSWIPNWIIAEFHMDLSSIEVCAQL